MTATLDLMSQKKAAKPAKPPTKTVRVNAALADDAAIAAAACGMSLPDYLDSRLRPEVDKDLKRFAQQIMSKGKSPPA